MHGGWKGGGGSTGRDSRSRSLQRMVRRFRLGVTYGIDAGHIRVASDRGLGRDEWVVLGRH